MRGIWRNAVVLLIIFIMGALLSYGWEMALSILIGGILSVINFHWMAAGVDRVLLGQSQQGAAWLIVKYLGRLLLIFLTLFAIMQTSFLSVIGALLGLSVFVLAGMLEAVLMIFKMR